MISSAALSGRAPAKPPARPGRAGRAAEAPDSRKARPGVTSTGRALHGNRRPVRLKERHTIPMTNIQQPPDGSADQPRVTVAEMEPAITVIYGQGLARGRSEGYEAGYEAGLAAARAGV